MVNEEGTLNIAEIPYDSGEVHFRYSRYLAPHGKKWIRHGLFVEYHRDGTVASEGHYEHGSEQGLWRDFHANGKLAAEGSYHEGKQHGEWSYWDEAGEPEGRSTYENGREVSSGEKGAD
jgi:antitoxin component YwqK of YwqJK toxin-antitoxin module